MAVCEEYKEKCPVCSEEYGFRAYSSINVSEDHELKEMVINGSIFMKTCPHCGHRELIDNPLVYHDPAENLFIVCYKGDLKAEIPEGSTGRLVNRIGDLIEKIKVFDAGLDDVVMELCKFITAQELGKKVELKFFRFDGADNEIILTYPENGEMQMISVGLNVYEDCAGIVARNPEMAESTKKGLVKVDQTWLSDYLA
ncbi:MAG: CpXC domain-containing protein [Bacteroidales bacterium]|nr:CpXC domain-containing protein [Bacteroidales bacterium]